MLRENYKGYDETIQTLETPMFKLVRHPIATQNAWIRNHPVQYVALNATLLVLWIGYMNYEDRKLDRQIENARNQHDI